ncbi:MAG: hypothetical protein QOI15_784 [Pseudonocardiales bacterium]|nr:hypothetical protein [Pseudonocardiales bacterium]
MRKVARSHRTARHRPRHARPSGLTPLRSLICLALFAGLAVAAGIAGKGGPAGAGAAHAAIPRPAAALEQPAIAGTDAPIDPISTDPSVENPLATDTSSSARDLGIAGISNSFPASGLASDGIPITALTAYQSAAVREANRNPACGLTWPLLAGIGRVESDHGRFAGAVLHSDGLSTPPVIGIPLDGNGTALILDTDNGAVDGDPVFDRAVGPMQFIPSTWAGWGVDANGDGVNDPFNVFDAAAAAADYLCAAGRDLSTTRGQVAAILSYNWSWDYVTMVMGLERVYASGAVGITVPVLPTSPDPHQGRPEQHPELPPVDPGKPRGAGSGGSPNPSPTAPTPHPTTPHPTTSHTSGSPTPQPSSSESAPSSGGSSSTSTDPGTPTPTESGCPSASESVSPSETASPSSAPCAETSASDSSSPTSASVPGSLEPSSSAA